MKVKIKQASVCGLLIDSKLEDPQWWTLRFGTNRPRPPSDRYPLVNNRIQWTSNIYNAISLPDDRFDFSDAVLTETLPDWYLTLSFPWALEDLETEDADDRNLFNFVSLMYDVAWQTEMCPEDKNPYPLLGDYHTRSANWEPLSSIFSGNEAEEIFTKALLNAWDKTVSVFDFQTE